MSSRLRRLQADYEAVVAAFRDHPHILLAGTEGSPPEVYRFEFHLRGLAPDGDSCVARDVHTADVFLLIDYPRRPPFCRMTSPVFHPNIDPAKVCIGDHWSAGQSLVDLVCRIGQMICYQSYNVKSPLNAQAAAWAEENAARLPLERVDLLPS